MADEVAPQTEGHRRGNKVGHETDETEAQAFQNQDQNDGNKRHGYDRATQHADYISLGEVSENDAHTRCRGADIGRVVTEPDLRPVIQLALLQRRQAAQHNRHARCRLGDVDTVVEVAAEREGQFVEQ